MRATCIFPGVMLWLYFTFLFFLDDFACCSVQRHVKLDSPQVPID